MSTDIVLREAEPPSAFEMRPRNLDEAMKFAQIMADSDLVPAGYKNKPGNILVACQMGHELGLTPMRALRCIAVINGRAAMFGDEMLAMVLVSPVCEYVHEEQSNDKIGICTVKRKGHPEHTATFSLDDAKRAGLLGKQGPWQQHTARMLKLRARGFALRDKFADVLAGLVTTEEALDIPPSEPQAVPTQPEPVQTLKDRLKAKVEAVEQAETMPIEEKPALKEQLTQSGTDASYDDLKSRLGACESVREISEVMNEAMALDLTMEQRLSLRELKEMQMKALKAKN